MAARCFALSIQLLIPLRFSRAGRTAIRGPLHDLNKYTNYTTYSHKAVPSRKAGPIRRCAGNTQSGTMGAHNRDFPAPIRQEKRGDGSPVLPRGFI